MPVKKTEVELKINNQAAKAYLAYPATGGPGVLVLHAWWGLKPFFKEVCDHLAEEGFVALAPDMRNGQIATTIEAATELMHNSDPAFTGQIVEAATNHLSSFSLRSGEKIGALGFSMGAGWALEAAKAAPGTVGAVVACYGAADPDFGQLKARFLGHYCEVDEWEPAEYVRSMQDAMQSAGVEAVFHFYPGVSHWFMETDRPEYDPAAAGLAWERTYQFLKNNLQQS